MKIDWKEIYDGTVKPVNVGTDMWGDESGAFDLAIAMSNQKMNKKFDIPIKSIPWSTDYPENVLYTLEWLLRDHRKEELRLDEDNIVEPVKDFWFRSAHFEGEYTHVCYPQDMLKFRTSYDATYAQLLSLPASAMSSHCLGIRDRLRHLLWSGWRCFGIDGFYTRTDGKTTYRYTCNRCGTPMPKAVKAFVILTQSKLASVVNE